MEDKSKLLRYIAKRNKKPVEVSISTPKPVAWYKRPLEHNEFLTRQGKDGYFYVRHNEWSKTVWIGPYKTKNETNEIIDSYVEISLKLGIENKVDSRVHSIIIANPDEFLHEC